MREAVASGLDRVSALEPRHGFAEVTGGARGDFRGGIVGFARGEVGAKLTPNVAIFGFGDATFGTPTPGWMAGVGGRVTW